MTTTAWIDVVPRGLATQGLSGMLFQTKPGADTATPSHSPGAEVFVIEMTGQQSQMLALDFATRGGQDQSQFASSEVLKAAGLKVRRCSFVLGLGGAPVAEIEVGAEEAISVLSLPPGSAIGFVIAHQAPFRASQEFIDFARRSRLSSGNFSVLVSERVRSESGRSVRWK